MGVFFSPVAPPSPPPRCAFLLLFLPSLSHPAVIQMAPGGWEQGRGGGIASACFSPPGLEEEEEEEEEFDALETWK